VLQYRRPKYAKADGEGILIEMLPSRTMEKGIAGEGLLTRMVIDKYVDHLPLYRQLDRFKRLNVNIAPSTASDWIASTCALLNPLFDVLKLQVLSATYLQADETPIKILNMEKRESLTMVTIGFTIMPGKQLPFMITGKEEAGRDLKKP